jgi:hypothetical protein
LYYHPGDIEMSFRIESLLPNYGALYDKLPIHAYVWQENYTGKLPIDILQLWDCMGYRFTIVEKIGLRNLGVKFLGKDENGITELICSLWTFVPTAWMWTQVSLKWPKNTNRLTLFD